MYVLLERRQHECGYGGSAKSLRVKTPQSVCYKVSPSAKVENEIEALMQHTGKGSCMVSS